MTGVVTASLPLEVRTVRRHDEADLQAACMAYLRLALPPDAVAHHSPGEGKRTLRAQRDLKRSGYQAGWPDIEIIRKDHPNIYVELKAARGQLSVEQRAMRHKLEYCGCAVLLCRTVEGMECALRELGVPLRASVKQQQQQRTNGHV
jgi:hypothetical protein